jgi:hypothetical protein
MYIENIDQKQHLLGIQRNFVFHLHHLKLIFNHILILRICREEFLSAKFGQNR